MRNWLAACFILFSVPVAAQDSGQLTEPLKKNAVTLKFFGLSAHIERTQNPEVFPNRLDKKGIFVPNYGGVAGYERFFYKDIFSVRLEQGVYADCSESLAGFTHLGWRGRIFKAGKHSLNGGIGPTLVYRRNWNRLPGYSDDGYFKQHGDWQYKFLWYAGEFEYNYRLTQHGELSAMIVPGFPSVISFGIGYKQWF